MRLRKRNNEIIINKFTKKRKCRTWQKKDNGF